MAGLELIVSLAADHGGVVAAVFQVGKIQPVPALGAGRLEVGADKMCIRDSPPGGPRAM